MRKQLRDLLPSRWNLRLHKRRGLIIYRPLVCGISKITTKLRLNYDAHRALIEINTQVSSVKNQLPLQAQQPVLT